MILAAESMVGVVENQEHQGVTWCSLVVRQVFQVEGGYSLGLTFFLVPGLVPGSLLSVEFSDVL